MGVRTPASWQELSYSAVGSAIGLLGYPLGIGLTVAGADSGAWGVLVIPLGVVVLVASQVGAFRIYRARRRLRPPN